MTLQLHLLLNQLCSEHYFSLNFPTVLHSWLANFHYNLGLGKQFLHPLLLWLPSVLMKYICKFQWHKDLPVNHQLYLHYHGIVC